MRLFQKGATDGNGDDSPIGIIQMRQSGFAHDFDNIVADHFIFATRNRRGGNDEFLASVTGGKRFLARLSCVESIYDAGDQAGHLPQALVSVLMTMSIVVVLEVIDIDEQQRN